MKELNYNQSLYDRCFLNCLERQVVVMMQHLGKDCRDLLTRTLVTSSDVFEQVILNKKIRAQFDSNMLSENHLRRCDYEHWNQVFSDFDEATQAIQEKIKINGFVCISGSVFYFPHCPEYLKVHLYHYITLTGFDETSQHWTIVDDDAAGNLKVYQYHHRYVRCFFDNCGLKNAQSFKANTTASDTDLLTMLSELLDNYSDQYELWNQLPAAFENPLEVPAVRSDYLNHALSVFFGSRKCLQHLLKSLFPEDKILHQSLCEVISKSLLLKNLAIKLRITGTSDSKRIEGLSHAIIVSENIWLDTLRSNIKTSTIPNLNIETQGQEKNV